jgi:hypothetical protein
MIKGFWDQNKADLQSVLKKILFDKYKVIPNYEYKMENGLGNKLVYVCLMKIKNESLLKGESCVSKVKAREDAVKKALKLLVPELYKQFQKDEAEISLMDENSSLFTEGSKLCDVIDLNSSRGSALCSFDFNNSNCSNILSTDMHPITPVKEESEFLSRKRKKENSKAKVDKEPSKSKRKAITNINEEDYVFGGCLVEDVYGNLQIDDPLVVDKYLKCSNFTPLIVNFLLVNF